jgi:CheY-like chemotaxis protein
LLEEDPIMSRVGSDALYVADESFKANQEAGSDANEGAEPLRDRPRVLVVDDQRLIADSLAEILGNEGFEAVAAYDGWEALEVVSRFRPDWLLSDVLMPRMNGVQLAITIRQNYPKVEILLFSGQAGISEILQECQQRGYRFELVPKPIHPLKLVERLKGVSET